MTIAKNILVYNELSKATSEAELDAAMKAAPSVDLENLQEPISHMKDYLSAAPVSAADGFAKDPKAWQNMEFGSFVAEEAGRDMTWPFLVGGIVTFMLLGMGIPSGLSKEGKRTSKYISMIEGRHGKIEGGHH
jgi:hypothetical protein